VRLFIVQVSQWWHLLSTVRPAAALECLLNIADSSHLIWTQIFGVELKSWLNKCTLLDGQLRTPSKQWYWRCLFEDRKCAHYTSLPQLSDGYVLSVRLAPGRPRAQFSMNSSMVVLPTAGTSKGLLKTYCCDHICLTKGYRDLELATSYNTRT
jgi:hypothetical protein